MPGARREGAHDRRKRAGTCRKVHGCCSLSCVYRRIVLAERSGGSGFVAQLTIDSPEGSSCRAARVGGHCGVVRVGL
jgi:hypothetical protein